MKVSSQEGFHTGDGNAAVKAAVRGMENLAGDKERRESQNGELKVGSETGAQVLSKAGKLPQQNGEETAGLLPGAAGKGENAQGGGIAGELAKLEADSMKASETMILAAVEKEERKDLAQLSQESKNAGEVKNWDSHAEAAAWNELTKWLPAGDREISAQIKELSELYMHLLDEIIQNVSEENRQLYTEKLRQILVCQLDELLKMSMPHLHSFFCTCGTQNSLCRLEKSLYFAVTGTHLSLEAVRKDWDAASRSGRAYIQNGKERGFHNSSFFSMDTGKEGKVYNRRGDAEKKLRAETGRTEELLQAARMLHQKGRANHGGENTYTLRDIERAEQFVKTLGGTSSGLFSNSRLTAGNECLYGVLWTVEKCKTQMFIERETNVSFTMKQEVESAVERMTADCMQEAVRKSHERGFEIFNRQQAYEIYRYAMKQYYSGVKVNKAIRDGFYYALKYFFQKTGSQEQESGEWKHGFFQEYEDKGSIKKELEKGSRFLEEDWKRFLSEMDYNDEMLQLAAGMYSPWAVFMEPEKDKKESPKKKGEAFAIAGAIAAVAAIVVLGIVFL